jgi:hypothetical protein
MGRSSEEFIKQRQKETDSLPANFNTLIEEPFTWRGFFEDLGSQYINKHTENEKQNI